MSKLARPEYALLGGDTPQTSDAAAHAFRTAPVFTGDALDTLGPAILPQRAVYGRVLEQHANGFPAVPAAPVLYINTNTPFSGLGTGKSHSTSVLLESCLMADARLGTLPEPLSALVFHFDTAAGGGAVQPCEAAYLSTLDAKNGEGAVAPTVTVLVLPSNLRAMKKVYAKLPAVHVEPLHFSPEDISGERLLAMMKVEESGQMPLYMEAVMTILRSMEDSFDYTKFREQLSAQTFSASQKSMLKLRLSLLDSCLKDGNASNRVSTHFKKGHLTIIDLSSPFMDGSSACGFFDLILGLFVEADVKASGKLVVLDEAHKYLSDAQSGASSRLTDSLLTIIRQYRHLGTRVLISTQEPTVVPSKFLALCSFIIAHRFQSPEWLRMLTKHVSVPERSFDELFAKVVSLQTGQAIMFTASGISVRGSHKANGSAKDTSSDGDSSVSGSEVAQLGAGYLLVQSRLRATQDGGRSILAVQESASLGGSMNQSSSGRASGTSLALHPTHSTFSFASQAAVSPSSVWQVRAPAAASESPSPRNSPEPSSSTESGSRTSSDASPEVFLMTSPALRKFLPLVTLMQQLFRDEELWRVKTQRLQRALDIDSDAIAKAVARGVIVRVEGAGTARVMLAPGATYVTERTVYLTGALRDCVPLVQYLKTQAESGFSEITLATLRKRFGQEVEEIVAKAKAQDVVEDVPNATKSKIRLCPHTKLVL
ncbi:hypothetical protein PsYK624_042480 [Phanerochaete sordida]|uniref:Zona occludens toxin N-terminal domain-containing protein n=1 Tax=Phanerochaete sordida TaxID=48140 RepID=A0A9P3LAG7_9APHY|nr:hypothetical protein PsYK624_042480 [Phanerochaete sordida]